MCSKSEHVIELLHTLTMVRRATDKFFWLEQAKITTHLEHMFDIQAKCRYIRPYER